MLSKIHAERKTSAADEMKKGLKYVVARLLRHLLICLNRVHKTEKNLILLESYLGTRLDCNPKAMYDYLRKRNPNTFRFVWVAQNPDEYQELAACPDTRIVGYRSREHWKYACVASVLITNSPRSNELPDRSDQLQIQTWHGGGCYKKVGTALHRNMPITRFITRSQFERYDFFISSSAFFSKEVIRGQYSFSGKILECGMPRNDRLVRNDYREREAIRDDLNLCGSDYLVLFAPTWRDFGDKAPLFDIGCVKQAFEKRFSKHIILGKRGHYFSEEDGFNGEIDLNNYHDMQGLLLAADAVITDYSSLIWDYSFTHRPCFLFVPDLVKYERDRGFDVDIHEWGFPVCESNEELVRAIEEFDQAEFEKAMGKHHEELDSFETGHACEAVAQVILDHCGISSNEGKQ